MSFAVERPSLDFNRLVLKPLQRLADAFPQRRQDWADLRDAAPQLQAIMEVKCRRPMASATGTLVPETLT